jgi:hypothetical protein
VPPVETTGLEEKALYWEWAGTDKFGQPLVKRAVELSVKWTKHIGAAPGPQGGSAGADATITVDRPVVLDSVVWEGPLEEWNPNPPTPVMLYRVTGHGEVRDIKGREVSRQVTLARYGGTVPDLLV